MRMALVAHNKKKDNMVKLATGTTGGRLKAEVGLAVGRLLNGPLGGELHNVSHATNLATAWASLS